MSYSGSIRLWSLADQVVGAARRFKTDQRRANARAKFLDTKEIERDSTPTYKKKS
jgi:hypothetical protein